MNTLRMAATELRRVTSGRLPKVAMLALTAVPLLYGGLYLYANHDPYGRLHEVPAAVVVEDRGATTSDGKSLAAGEQVAHDLLASHSFDWHRTSAAQASAGVRNGRYDFALTLPADFSAALASTGRYQPRQGTLVLTTNDANNAVVHTIADQVADRVRDSLARQVGARAADEFLLGFTTLRGQIGEAADGADRLASGATQARDGAGQLVTGADDLAAGQRKLLAGSGTLATGTADAATGAAQLASGADQLAGGLSTLRQNTADLPEQANALATGARQVADGNTRIATLGGQVAGSARQLVDGLDRYRSDLEARLRAAGLTEAQIQQILGAADQLRQPVQDANNKIQSTAGQLDQLADGSRRVADGSAKLAESAPALADGIGRAADGASELKGGAHRLATGTAQLRDGAATLRDGETTAVTGTDRLAAGTRTLGTGLGDLAGGAGTLRDGLRSGTSRLPQLSDGDRAATANTIADPVTVRNVAHSRARSYGAGLAPFFVSLAAWIGGYVLFLFLRPLSTRAMAANQPPLRVAIAGWLTPAALGAAQMVALFLVLLLWLRLDPAHPLGTAAFMVLASAAFVAIVHALNAWLGVVGEFLGLVAMVAQLVSAGGTFPWQTLPGPLQTLHDVLPMGYAVDALRQLLYGGDLAAVGRDATVLAAYLAAALGASTLAARRLRVWTPARIKPELVL